MTRTIIPHHLLCIGGETMDNLVALPWTVKMDRKGSHY